MFTSTVSRALLGAICATLAISACGHHTHGTAAAQPATQPDAESLLVNIDDLRRITGTPELEQGSELSAKPHVHHGQLPDSCNATSSTDVIFGQNWTQFKGFPFTAVEGNHAEGYRVLVGSQAVGIYPDDATARTAFTQLLANLKQCSETHWGPFVDLTIEPQDPSNFATRLGTNYSLYRVRDNVLIEVTTGKFSNTEQVAHTIMRMISDRINGT